ncbi:MAG: cytochrome c peroxidase [Bacteroidota bacterium]
MRIVLIIAVIVFSIGFISYAPDDNHAGATEKYYLQQLNHLKETIANLQQTISEKNNIEEQKKAFKKARCAYKQLSVITDYLNPYETILLNSAAILRTEDDNPTQIIAPHGWQQLEALIWDGDIAATATENKLEEIIYINDVIEKLLNETGRINKFSNTQIWEALRATAFTIVTKTITSFDTPLAQNGLDECKASLIGTKKVIDIFQQRPSAEAGLLERLVLEIEKALIVLNQQHDANAFDKLSFIKNNMITVTSLLTKVAVEAKFIQANERRPLNQFAESIFAPDAFDVNFFSPNKRYQFTKERMLLGKQLFYDTRLSGDGKRSCATCHNPALAFTDGAKTALSTDNKTALNRNTPTLLNSVFQTRQFYDSRQTMLEFQVSNVVHNNLEMGGSTEYVAGLIKKDSMVSLQFESAYPGDKEAVTPYTIANAISNYMRSLQAMNTRFDRYMRNEPVTFSNAEKNGFNLFMGKAKCGTCHFMPLFNGLVPPQFNETESEILGVPAGLKKPYVLDSDSGKYQFTKSVVHLFSFKTPTLRNIALTSPYMHNGIYKTLEQVMDFYNKGGGKGLGIAPENQSLPFDKLHLSKPEMKDIIAFMRTLTDTTSYKIKSN